MRFHSITYICIFITAYNHPLTNGILYCSEVPRFDVGPCYNRPRVFVVAPGAWRPLRSVRFVDGETCETFAPKLPAEVS